MRIRRYAARLLSSSATGNPGSPPPQPAAAWLHAADDDCCAFCDVQSQDSLKHKGHIAGRLPESDARSGERVGRAQGPPTPEAKNKKCKIDHGPPFSEADVGLGAANDGDSFVSEDAVKLEDGRLATLIAKDDVNPAPLTEEVAFHPEAATLPGVTGIEPVVTGGDSVMNESGEELGAPRTDSLVNEASTETELTEGISQMSKTVTDAGATIPVPEVTGTASLSSEGFVQPEITGKASLVQGATELEATEGPVASKTAQEPEDSGRRITCSVDDDPALHEALHPIFDTTGNVKAGNAGETVAAAMKPSHYDADAADGNDVDSPSNSTVGAKDPTVEGGVARNRSVTPSVSCVAELVARSVGRSWRTDVICYARRKGKKKPDLLEVKTEHIELENGVLCDQLEEDGILESNGPCGLVTSGAESADIKLADIKRELMDNSTARMAKKMKTRKFACDIDYCRMTFKTKTELSVHKKNICTVKSCSRHFRSHKYLRRHQSVHNDYKPYKCPWEGCRMAFKWSSDRAEHFQVHAGVKPYKCTTPGCSKIYKFVSDFTRHRRRCKPQR